MKQHAVRKRCSLLAGLLMILYSICLPFSTAMVSAGDASTAPVITIDSVTGMPGDVVPVQLTIQNHTTENALSTLGIAIEFPEALELQLDEDEEPQIKMGPAFSTWQKEAAFNETRVSIAMQSYKTPVFSDGEVVTFYFKIPEDAKRGTVYPLNFFTCQARNTSLTATTCITENGQIQVTPEETTTTTTTTTLATTTTTTTQATTTTTTTTATTTTTTSTTTSTSVTTTTTAIDQALLGKWAFVEDTDFILFEFDKHGNVFVFYGKESDYLAGNYENGDTTTVSYTAADGTLRMIREGEAFWEVSYSIAKDTLTLIDPETNDTAQMQKYYDKPIITTTTTQATTTTTQATTTTTKATTTTTQSTTTTKATSTTTTLATTSTTPVTTLTTQTTSTSADPGMVKVISITGKPGETVPVTLSASDFNKNNVFSALGMSLQYDSRLSVVMDPDNPKKPQYTPSEGFTLGKLSCAPHLETDVRAVGITFENTTGYILNGDLITLYFKIPETVQMYTEFKFTLTAKYAAAGETPITVNTEDGNVRLLPDTPELSLSQGTAMPGELIQLQLTAKNLYLGTLRLQISVPDELVAAFSDLSKLQYGDVMEKGWPECVYDAENQCLLLTVTADGDSLDGLLLTLPFAVPAEALEGERYEFKLTVLELTGRSITGNFIHTFTDVTLQNGLTTVAKPKDPEREMGDVNNDGFIDTDDAVMVQKHFAVTILDPKGGVLTEEQRAYADLNNDGAIDTDDAIKIQKIYAKNILG